MGIRLYVCVTMEAVYLYKCRLCDERVIEMVGGWDTNIIVSEILEAEDGKRNNHNRPSMTSLHHCKDGIRIGITDFIGVSSRTTEPINKKNGNRKKKA